MKIPPTEGGYVSRETRRSGFSRQADILIPMWIFRFPYTERSRGVVTIAFCLDSSQQADIDPIEISSAYLRALSNSI